MSNPIGTDGRPHFAVGSALFGVFVTINEEQIKLVSDLGFPGLELYGESYQDFAERKDDLKKMLADYGVTLITISNRGSVNGRPVDFITPELRQETIDDHTAWVRDNHGTFGCKHFKINMGRRGPNGTSDDDMKALADGLNQLGKNTADLGVKLSPHPHIWGPVERPEEINRLMELTDPRYVSLLPDTAHLNLGGGDPLALMTEHYGRVDAIHWKDTRAKYRGFTGPTPTREEHLQEILYKDLGTGGVDIPGIWQMLLARGYSGWITLDLDPPRPNEGEGSYADKLRINHRFLLERLQVATL
ncbi:MAG: TIM barrel protein [Chloroflexi bacterium]|nr:TIM barrel protein [Chloroflexota bacterium]